MEYKITGCKPEKLFHFFEDISAIPRGSGNEKGLSDYLVKFAKDRNLWVYQDESNNVIIKKEGSEGAKDKAPVDRKSTRLNSSHASKSRMPSSA